MNLQQKLNESAKYILDKTKFQPEIGLIGKIAEGVSLDSLCAGVNYSLYKRLEPVLANFKSRRLVISGGVAKNQAIQKYLNESYDEVIPLDDPQFNGAIGCCYYGYLKSRR